jgi:beta-lactam-binding protein with PASTA domain
LEICKKKCTFAEKLAFFLIHKHMNKKHTWQNSSLRFVVNNCIYAVIVCVILVVILVLFLRYHTQHGKEVAVPALTSLYIEEADIIASSKGLKLVIIDSTYSNKTPLGTLVEQTPQAGAMVKKGRTIYAVQNARFRRPIILPELRDISLRQAETSLGILGIHVKEIRYEPSTFKNIILDVRQAETSIPAGARLSEGDTITLVVGKGQGSEDVVVPSVIGKSLTDARSWLIGNMLSIGVVEYDIVPTDSILNEYVVYSQTPESGTVVVEGTSVHLKLSTDIEKTVTADNIVDEEEFF